MAEQMTLDLPLSPIDTPEGKVSDWSQTFTIDTGESVSVAKFEKKFGYKPELVFQ